MKLYKMQMNCYFRFFHVPNIQQQIEVKIKDDIDKSPLFFKIKDDIDKSPLYFLCFLL